MQFKRLMDRRSFVATLGLIACGAITASAQAGGIGVDNIRVGRDNNSADNPFIQPATDALSGGGRDQSIQFGDDVFGSKRDDLLVGALGADVMVGGPGNDVIVGGLEHFNPNNRDRAFGGYGNDIFIWKPGDGSDAFSGGPGYDAVILGVAGEIEDGKLTFAVKDDRQAGALAVNRRTKLPFVDVTNSPGFCDVIDASSAVDAGKQLRALGLDDLVRFSIRGIADSFDRGEQAEDNGLRVTLHLKSVELLICTSREGGEIEAIDLTTTPASKIDLSQHWHPRYRKMIARIKKIVR